MKGKTVSGPGMEEGEGEQQSISTAEHPVSTRSGGDGMMVAANNNCFFELLQQAITS